MSTFWSLWVMALIVLNLGITFFLFIWGQRVKVPTQKDGTTGHVWAHGVLREGVRKLPLWWVLLSASAFVLGAIYLALYPGFGAFAGLLGWSSQNRLAQEVTANRITLEKNLSDYASTPLIKLVRESSPALRIGERLFTDNCAACHGRDAQGNVLLGAPDLTDADWLYGGSEVDIKTSIREGRQGMMPPLGDALGDAVILQVANYVLSLSGAPHAAEAAAGAPMFALCAGCHGPEGKGNPLLGAPNLTDSIWLYGGGLATIEQTIRHGRNGVMPGWKTRLDEAEIHLLVAWMQSRLSTHDESRAP